MHERLNRTLLSENTVLQLDIHINLKASVSGVFLGNFLWSSHCV